MAIWLRLTIFSRSGTVEKTSRCSLVRSSTSNTSSADNGDGRFGFSHIFTEVSRQGLFLDTFPPNQLNSSWRFSSFFGIWPEFFQDFARVLSFFTKYTLSFFGYGIYSMEYVIFMSNKECIMDFHWKKLLFHKLYFCNVDCPFYFNFKTDEVLKSFEEIDFLAFAL